MRKFAVTFLSLVVISSSLSASPNDKSMPSLNTQIWDKPVKEVSAGITSDIKGFADALQIEVQNNPYITLHDLGQKNC